MHHFLIDFLKITLQIQVPVKALENYFSLFTITDYQMLDQYEENEILLVDF